MMEHEVFRKLRQEMRSNGYDALVALSPDNVTYTAGFLVPSHTANRFRRTVSILAGDSFAAQIVVNVEENLARQHSRFQDIRPYNQFTQDPADLIADALTQAGVPGKRIAIELDYMPAVDYIRLVDRLPMARLEGCKEIYFKVRMAKTEEEIARLREIGELSERVMAEVLETIRPGQTEKEVGSRIADLMIRSGSDSVRFHVGSGTRSGITNCDPTDKIIEKGDVVRVEILGEKENYRSNLTRTAVVGRPTPEQEGIWKVLIGARNACRAMLRPGTRVPDLYATYVKACRDGGIEPTLKFLGHGIGVTIHEEPYITETRDIMLAPNMTHTMEPLYMMPGQMGFHVEDMYLITEQGFESITGEIVPNDTLIEIGN